MTEPAHSLPDASGLRPPARVTFVAGKGGVGKTTVAAALALAAAGAGMHVLFVSVDGRSDVLPLFGASGTLTYADTTLREVGGGSITARSLAPDEALVEYLDNHGLRRISRRLASTGTLEVIATAVPGIREILVLGKIKQLERLAAAGGSSDSGGSDRYGGASGSGRSNGSSVPECIVVDAPAAGHAVSLLASPHGLLDAAGGGPIRSQAEAVVEMLGDPERCEVLLVTVPEETPVNETAETAYVLEDRAGVRLAPVVVNGVWPVLDLPGEGSPAARFRLDQQAQQAGQIRRLADSLPLPQIHLPYLFTTDLTPGDLDLLTSQLTAGWMGCSGERR